MYISEQGLTLIRQFEGFSATMYICPAGKQTIGYGHVVREGEDYSQAPLSPQQANNILIQDVGESERAVSRLVDIPLNQNQFDALVAFVYNVGAGAFEKSCLLRMLNAGNIAAAANEFSRWVFAGGRKIDGLARRRVAEATLFSANQSIFP